MGELDDVSFTRQLAARKYLPADELHELQIADRDRNPLLVKVISRIAKDRVQEHAAVIGQNTMSHVEERGVTRFLEGLERADTHDPIDGFVKFFPALQTHL